VPILILQWPAERPAIGDEADIEHASSSVRLASGATRSVAIEPCDPRHFRLSSRLWIRLPTSGAAKSKQLANGDMR